MQDNEIIRKIMKENKVTQPALAEVLGYSDSAGVRRVLNRKHGIRTDILVKFLSAMGYEVVVRNKLNKKEEYVVE